MPLTIIHIITDNEGHEMELGGLVGIITGRDGSKHENKVFQIAVCDKCIDNGMEYGFVACRGEKINIRK